MKRNEKSFSCFADKIFNWNEMKCYRTRFFSSRFSGRIWIGGSESEWKTRKTHLWSCLFLLPEKIFREWRRAGLLASDVKIPPSWNSTMIATAALTFHHLLHHLQTLSLRKINKQAHAVKCYDNKFKFSVFSLEIPSEFPIEEGNKFGEKFNLLSNWRWVTNLKHFLLLHRPSHDNRFSCDSTWN